MSAFDLVIRNPKVATAADTFDSDIGIKDGVIVMLGKNLPKATKEIDAAGRVVTPGGIDGHCHLDQPMPRWQIILIPVLAQQPAAARPL